MVQRMSQSPNFGGAQSAQSVGSSVGFTNPDVDKFREVGQTDLNLGGDTVNRLVSSIMDSFQPVIQKLDQRQDEEAYLRGAAQVGIIKSEKDLNSNPLTANWTRAGFRDTTGRLKIAQEEAKLTEDMQTWRERSPTEFGTYLAERRQKLMPSITGMSRQQRKAQLDNLLLNDQKAIRLHQVEYGKYQMELEAKSIQAGFRPVLQQLEASKVDKDAYQIASRAAFSYIRSATIDNPKLTPALRSKMLVDSMEYALSQDHTQLYKEFQSLNINPEIGPSRTLESYLSWDDSVKLNKQYREAQERTKGVRGMEFNDQKAKFEADFQDPLKPLSTPEEARTFAGQGVRSGFMSGDGYASFMENYWKHSAKKADQGALATAWSQGNTAAMWTLGKTGQEGFDAWWHTVGKTLPQPEAMQQLLKIGTANSRPEALVEFGKQFAPMFTTLGLGDKIDATAAANVHQFFAKMSGWEQNAQEGYYSLVMQSLSPEQREKFMMLKESFATGIEPTIAAQQVQTRINENQKLSPTQRDALNKNAGQQDATILDSLEPRSVFGTIGLKLKSFVSQDAAAAYQIRPFQAWFEDEARVNEATASVKYAAAEELRSISAGNPFLSESSRKSMALSAVAARTVETTSGPLILPRGMSKQQVFGTPTSVSNDSIGMAISQMHQAQEGNRLAYTVTSAGQLTFKELNKSGMVVNSGAIPASQVNAVVVNQQNTQIQQYNAQYGDGVTVSNTTFNGNNTAGVSNAAALQIRKNLVTHEGFADKPYADLSGKKHSNGEPIMTVGAGISSTNQFYPKQFDQKSLDDAFMRASDAAMKTAAYAQNQYQLPGVNSLALMSELYYQSSPGPINAFARELQSAYRSRNEQAAREALHKTEAYRISGKNRQQFYDSLIPNIMKGM